MSEYSQAAKDASWKLAWSLMGVEPISPHEVIKAATPIMDDLLAAERARVVDVLDDLLGCTIYSDNAGIMPAAMSHMKASACAAYVKRQLAALRDRLTDTTTAAEGGSSEGATNA